MLPISTAQAEKVLAEYYYPYRQKIENQVSGWVEQGYSVLHVSIHSFPPELNGNVRKADIGLLYDPKREREQLFAARWRQQLHLVLPKIKIRYNYPYKGTSDGFISQLRRNFSNVQYAGLELTINQQYMEEGAEEWKQLQTYLLQTFTLAL
jgi:predicted N-formylglutamate amidohydrolase